MGKILRMMGLSFAILLLFIIMGYFLIPPNVYETQMPEFENVEAPLVKNKNLTLQDGEVYRYMYTTENQSGNVTFTVQKLKKCTYISTTDISGLGACLDNEGNDYSGSNVSLVDGNIFMFKPWMLALDDGWEWNASVYAVTNSTKNYVFDITYKVIRTDHINGRPAYFVEISMGGITFYEWVDKEKRIVVRETGYGATIELIEGLEP